MNVPFEDWAGQFENDILIPGIDFLKGEAEYLQSTQLSTGVDDVIEMFKEQAAAPGATIAALTQEWNETVVPALRALYQDLYDDIAGADGIINTTREEADLLKLGSEADFVSGFGSDVFNPLVSSLQSRQSRSRSALGQNAISRGQFNLGNATDETDFEAQRENLITAINAYYDAEEARIEQLKLTEDELRDLREDTQLAREQALRQAETATNRFADERIRNEMRVADQIQDLRDKQLENEEERLTKLTELHEDAAKRLEEIEEASQRRREDSNLTFQRKFEDIRRKAFEAENEVIRQLRAGDITREQGDERLATIDRNRTRDLFDAGIEENRRQEDIGITRQRAEEDLQENTALREQELIEQSETLAFALRDALAPLLESQSAAVSTQVTAAERTSTAAVLTTEAATMLSDGALTLETVSANLQVATADQTTAAIGLQTAGVSLSTAANALLDAARVQGLRGAAEALRTAAMDLKEVVGPLKEILLFIPNFLNKRILNPTPILNPIDPNAVPQSQPTGNGSSPQGSPVNAPPQIQRPPQESTIVIKNELHLPDESVQSIGDTIVKQRAEGRSLL